MKAKSFTNSAMAWVFLFCLSLLICACGGGAEDQARDTENQAPATSASSEPTGAESVFDETSIALMKRLAESGFCPIPIDEKFAKIFAVPVDTGLLLAPISLFVPEESFIPSELAAWDIIVECNGEKVNGWKGLKPQGRNSKLNLKVYRRGELVSVVLVLEEVKTPEPSGTVRRQSLFGEQRHIVYYTRGEKPWDRKQTLLEEGDGIIRGRMTVSDKPAEGVAISLLLAGDKRTQPATTDADGRFEIRLPPGDYLYLGYVMAESNVPERHMIAVDRRLGPVHMRGKTPAASRGDKVTERFKELASKHGSAEAAKMLAEEFKLDFTDPFSEKFPLEVTASSPVDIPDIIYRDPVKIVSPLHKSSVSLRKLSFAWIPYESADSYEISVCYIKKRGTGATYSPICGQTVSGNSIDASDLRFDSSFGIDERVQRLIPGEWFGARVFAYDKDGDLLSASSEHQYVEFFIK